MAFADNLARITDRIESVKNREGLTHDVVVLAVSKYQSIEAVEEALKSGFRLFGENRVQEAVEKFTDPRISIHKPTLHLIGHLQRNKTRKIIQHVNMIQSIDKIETLETVNRICTEIDRGLDYLIEVNTSFEPDKHGLTPDNLFSMLDAISKGIFPKTTMRGLMTIGPLSDDMVKVRKSFELLRSLFDKINSQYDLPGCEVLSMGMSGDYEEAIAAGSTMVRIGSALFK